jgi:hypothetical protein
VALIPQVSLARICSRLQLHRRPLSTWVGVDTSYVVEFYAGDLIFLKANHVADALNSTRPSLQDTTPYLRYPSTSQPPCRERVCSREVERDGLERGQRERGSDIGCEETSRTLSLLNGHHPLYLHSTTSASPSTIENFHYRHRQSQRRFTNKRTYLNTWRPLTRHHHRQPLIG